MAACNIVCTICPRYHKWCDLKAILKNSSDVANAMGPFSAVYRSVLKLPKFQHGNFHFPFSAWASWYAILFQLSQIMLTKSPWFSCSIWSTQKVASSSKVPEWILVIGGAGIVCGLALYGYKIMRVIGVKSAKLTNTRGRPTNQHLKKLIGRLNLRVSWHPDYSSLKRFIAYWVKPASHLCRILLRAEHCHSGHGRLSLWTSSFHNSGKL